MAKPSDGLRDKVFLATKVLGSNLRYDQVLLAAEQSLRLLDVDCVDLYQIHWYNRGVPLTETMRAMESLVDRGMVKYIGVSNFSTKELQEAQAAMTKHPIVSNQVLYNLNTRRIERDLLPYCQQNKITIIAYTPLDSGSLASSPTIHARAAVPGPWAVGRGNWARPGPRSPLTGAYPVPTSSPYPSRTAYPEQSKTARLATGSSPPTKSGCWMKLIRDGCTLILPD